MSTRGIIGFIIDGQEKLTYNHSDSYPSWLGREVLEFIASAELEAVREGARKIVLVDEESKPTAEQVAALGEFLDTGVGGQSANDWYCLLRQAQGDLAAYLKAGYMIDSRTFVIDSLFCEWGYILNLDTWKLEVYRGFNKNPKAAGRYAKLKEKPWKRSDGQTVRPEYNGIVLIEELDLAQIQSSLQSAAGTFSKTKPAELIDKITSGWERISSDQREAEERTRKEKAEVKASAKRVVKALSR